MLACDAGHASAASVDMHLTAGTFLLEQLKVIVILTSQDCVQVKIVRLAART
jgi:hypothetical protein